MEVRWTDKSLVDLNRLHAFLRPTNPQAAARVVRSLIAAAKRLEQFPQLGTALPEFAPRNVRRLIVADYEMRYELKDDALFILRVWRAREDR
ncbi:type II toxin-antitoxin system RelE/ParE family toxin [Gloeobacter kilaueensis]|uniref:Plasmid stabilization system protein n=1 Tax=Gloeobacter kilaueensis (strain ATCC BAA-2537 / CCAP 1431/1 / ULC 316 / JS1) TaxID=1183438 RepID=U5QRS2_GLOK1|nr:type II toxin-antitoxin system RelE/ParE family toxin [Gloeobacter kilaueensis]AGY60309.1 plasmid stabilization system protein [Gloeobacter kilaueensis JS1]